MWHKAQNLNMKKIIGQWHKASLINLDNTYLKSA